ncbi:MAG: DUF721 domain-containing protein [Deltaproteobacteria bacterium]|nr:DUF721 domain-containing protein [Deltaproteobacteria bacterium]
MIFNLRELLRGALGKAGLETTSDVWQLAEIWSATLGPQIAARATPVRLARGELVIAVAESVWRQELQLLAPQIAAKLNRALGRDVVQRVRLVGGDATAPDPTTARDRPRRRLPQLSSATLPGARTPEGPRGGDPELGGEIGQALRSLAAKRAERIVADAEPARARRPGAPQARPRRGW